jgi:hypothetical protein
MTDFFFRERIFFSFPQPRNPEGTGGVHLLGLLREKGNTCLDSSFLDPEKIKR